MKLRHAVPLILILAILLAWFWFFYREGGVTHRELADLIAREGAMICKEVDTRCDALDAKLDRIESKLDKLIELATPRLPDGMTVAE